MVNTTNKFRWWNWGEGNYNLSVVFCFTPKRVIPKIGFRKIVYTIILKLDFIGLQQTTKYLIHIV